LTNIVQKYPQVKVLTCDVRELPLSETYDLIFAIGIDYVLGDEELSGLFACLAKNLSESGKIVLHSSSILSLKNTVSLLEKSIERKIGITEGVFWGWFRTPRTVNRLAAKIGLSVHEQYFVSDKGPSTQKHRYTAKKRLGMLNNIPPMLVTSMFTLFKHGKSKV